MKKLIWIQALAMAGLYQPLTAQWSPVRYDQVNNFGLVDVPAEHVVVALGSAPGSSDAFLMRSVDGGQNWDSLAVQDFGNTLDIQAMDFPSAEAGYVTGRIGSAGFILFTQDSGRNWEYRTPPVFGLGTIKHLSFLSATQGYVSDATNLYYTNDAGLNWTVQSLDFTLTDLVFLDAQTGYACGNFMHTNSYGYVLRTTDSGVSWDTLLKVHDPELFVTQLEELQVSASEGRIALAIPNKVAISTDNGLSWDWFTTPGIHGIRTFVAHSSKDFHILTYGGEIYSTTNQGGVWNLEYTTDWDLYGPDVHLFDLVFGFGTGYVAGTSGLIKKRTASVGIEKPGARPSPEVYPNFASPGDIVWIRAHRAEGMQRVVLQGMAGRIVQDVFLNFSQDLATEMRIPHVPHGFYLLQIGGSEASKLFVLP